MKWLIMLSCFVLGLCWADTVGVLWKCVVGEFTFLCLVVVFMLVIDESVFKRTNKRS